jgi:hypothetical protein
MTVKLEDTLRLYQRIKQPLVIFEGIMPDP